MVSSQGAGLGQGSCTGAHTSFKSFPSVLKCAWGRGLNSRWFKQGAQIFLALSSPYFDQLPRPWHPKAFHKREEAPSDGLHRVTAYLHISSQNLSLLTLGRGEQLGMRRCPVRSTAPAGRSPFEPEVLGSPAVPCIPPHAGLCLQVSLAKRALFPALRTAWGWGLSREFKIP